MNADQRQVDEAMNTVVKSLNEASLKFMNKSKNLDDSLNILLKCEALTYPGKYGIFPELRTYVFNYLGCFYRRKEHFQIAINYFVKALRIIETSNLKSCKAMTHMNLSAVLSQTGK